MSGGCKVRPNYRTYRLRLCQEINWHLALDFPTQTCYVSYVEETVMRQVTVKPISNKAKNRFANQMDSNPICDVHQDTGGELFLASQNRNYFMWVSVRSGTNRFGNKADQNWEIISDTQSV
jgi:hypothetical protein